MNVKFRVDEGAEFPMSHIMVNTVYVTKKPGLRIINQVQHWD